MQIGFNAWHYADSNLWASLGDEIFEQLAGPGRDATQQREALREELAERLQRRKELQAATERAKAETARLTGELDNAIAAPGECASMAKAVFEAPELNDELKGRNRLGVPDAKRIEAAHRGAAADRGRHAARRAVARVPRWTLAAGVASRRWRSSLASRPRYLAGAGLRWSLC